MGARPSQKQINSRIYNRLQTIKRQLQKAGVAVIYKDKSLVRYETTNTEKIGGFNISYRTLHANNGEVAGFPVIYITGTMSEDGTYGWQKPQGSFDMGINKIIEAFAEPGLQLTGLDELGMITRRSR
jgi:hypothetical protein